MPKHNNLTYEQQQNLLKLAAFCSQESNAKWVAARKIKLVEKSEKPTLHNSDPHRSLGGIFYFTPVCFGMPSTGSLPCGDYDHREQCDGQQPANVTSIQKVRLMQARDKYRPPKVDVNLAPWEMGQAAAMGGKGQHGNPYDLMTETEQYLEWMDGYESL